MTSSGEQLVSAFRSLEGIGPLRQWWLSSAELLVARAGRELADGEDCCGLAIGENPGAVLEGILLTDRRIGVIGRYGVSWFPRESVWEVSSSSTTALTGEVLRVYGDDWELVWAQLRPLGVAQEMGDNLRQGLSERAAQPWPADTPALP